MFSQHASADTFRREVDLEVISDYHGMRSENILDVTEFVFAAIETTASNIVSLHTQP